MSENLLLIEVEFLYYLIPVIIGLQLAAYFIYQFYKIRDVNLRLNRILISYGLFSFGIIVGAFFIQIARNFLTGPLEVLFYRLGWGFSFFSPIGLSVFILTTKEVHQMFNLIIIWALMILNILAVLFSVLTYDPNQQVPLFRILFVVSVVFVVLNGVNLLIFQALLVRKSVGAIKVKLTEFFAGMIISLMAPVFAILVGMGVLPFGINEIVYFIGVTLLLAGFIVIFISVYDFPPFYEFEWRDSLLKLFIINQKNNTCLFFSDLAEFLQKVKDLKEIDSTPREGTTDKYFSGSLMGIEEVISQLTDTRSEKINLIKYEDSYILIEYGTEPDYITYVLLVKKELLSIHHLLRTIRKQFESFYREILLELDTLKGNQELLFGSFDVLLKHIIQEV